MKYVLVNERRPQDFMPIYWSNESNMYKLDKIDYFTSKFSEEEFKKYLISNDLVDNDNINLQIIFNDGKIRKLKDGLIYKDEYQSDYLEYIKEFIKNNVDNKPIINELIQKTKSNVLISEYTKELLSLILINSHLPKDEILFLLDRLKGSYYIESRTIYLYIKRVLEVKVNNKVKVLNKIDNEI